MVPSSRNQSGCSSVFGHTSSTAISSFVTSGRTPIITSLRRRSSSSWTSKWTPSTHTWT